MHNTENNAGRRRPWILAGFVLLTILLVLAAGCGRSRRDEASQAPASAGEPGAALKQIAMEYAQHGDLAKAQAALGALGLANPTQLLVAAAEEAINRGAPRQEIQALARLAAAMGVRSPKLVAYLEPTPTPVPTDTSTPAPSPTPSVTATPTPAPTDTPAGDASPPGPGSAATTVALPQEPRVVAGDNANLRGGPGKQYPVVGQLRSGQEVDIIARNESGDWWQLAWDGVAQAWVAGTVVQVLGPIDTVAVAEDIPAPPPTNTPAPPPPPTAPPPTPKPSIPYVVQSVRVRPLGQDAQQCGGGDHNIFVLVTDPNGVPLDGVRVREVFTGIVHGTGEKGPGRVDFTIYMNGGGQVEIVDESNNPISPQSRGMSANLPDWDLFLAAGYCTCKPYPDVESCRAGWEARDFRYMPNSHYVYEVVFQRTY